MLIASAGLFGIFLFLTYYLQQTLGYSPLVTGVAFLPLSAGLILAANLSTTVLMPRFGPRPLVASGMLAAAGAMAWLAQLGPHTAYAAGVLGPTILAGIGVGLVIAPVINTGTFGVAPQDAGVASATVTVGQLVDRRHLRRRRGHRRRPAPPRATAPAEYAAPGTRGSDNCKSQCRPLSSRVMSPAQILGVRDAGNRRAYEGCSPQLPALLSVLFES